MAKRKNISKKIRFEVFKRDKFTCQYCGKKSPDIILEIDHIDPVSKGGNNDILNLLTSCKECNSGKRDIKLNDSSVIEKQRKQLEEIQERREQMEMMLQWRKTLDNFENDKIELICDYFNEKISPFSLNAIGKDGIQKLLNKFEIPKVLDSVDIAVKNYLQYDEEGKPTKESVEIAINKLGGILHFDKLSPLKQKLAYIKGICRNRFNYWDNKVGSIILNNYVEALKSKGWSEAQIIDDLDTEVIKISKQSKNWSEWRNQLDRWIEDIDSWDKENDEDDKYDKYDNLDCFQVEEIEKNMELFNNLLVGYYEAIGVFVEHFPNYDSEDFKLKVNHTIISIFNYAKDKIDKCNEFYSLNDQELSDIISETELLSFTDSYLKSRSNCEYFLANAIYKMTIIFLEHLDPSSAFGVSRRNQLDFVNDFYHNITA